MSGIMSTNVVAASERIMLSGSFAPGTSGFSDGAAAGSMTPNTFRGEFCEFLATAPLGNFFFFALAGIGIPNTDATFNRLEIRGTFLGGTNPRTIIRTRSAMVYKADVSGNTQWEFDPANGTIDNFLTGLERYTVLYI